MTQLREARKGLLSTAWTDVSIIRHCLIQALHHV